MGFDELGCFRVTTPTAAEPATSTATAAAVTRSPVVTTVEVTTGAAVEVAASSWAGWRTFLTS